MVIVTNVAETVRSAVARMHSVMNRRQIRVIPASEATLTKLAKDPHVTVKLTDEQAERLHEIENGSEPTTAAPSRTVKA
jgi:hypothetical protein